MRLTVYVNRCEPGDTRTGKPSFGFIDFHTSTVRSG